MMATQQYNYNGQPPYPRGPMGGPQQQPGMMRPNMPPPNGMNGMGQSQYNMGQSQYNMGQSQYNMGQSQYNMQAGPRGPPNQGMMPNPRGPVQSAFAQQPYSPNGMAPRGPPMMNGMPRPGAPRGPALSPPGQTEQPGFGLAQQPPEQMVRRVNKSKLRCCHALIIMFVNSV
jgi:hypothetical protein